MFTAAKKREEETAESSFSHHFTIFSHTHRFLSSSLLSPLYFSVEADVAPLISLWGRKRERERESILESERHNNAMKECWRIMKMSENVVAMLSHDYFSAYSKADNNKRMLLLLTHTHT
jgi:hypothetical protein